MKEKSLFPSDWATTRPVALIKMLTIDPTFPGTALTPEERVRLLRLIASPGERGGDDSVYASVPPLRDEFSVNDDPLAWEAEGWENFG